MKRMDDEMYGAVLARFEESESEYEAFLARWGIDRRAIGRAARGEHLAAPAKRAMLDRARAGATEEDGVEIDPIPLGTGAIAAPVPSHAIRI